ncbi:MAG: hypothetical protein HZB51_14520 [Chloroflexi bacterium]|nr:hypothetical protein [Chloroflexota bacterium]
MQITNRTIATVGWGALLIWWGIAIAVGPITVGLSVVGTGLILLAANAVRWLNGLPTKSSTTTLGIIALAWGTLDHALALRLAASFATLLIIIGSVTIASLINHPKLTRP